MPIKTPGYLTIGLFLALFSCSSTENDSEELRNGYEITVEASPYEFLKKKSGYSKNPEFQNLIARANTMNADTGKDYWDCLLELTDTSYLKLSAIFYREDEKYEIQFPNAKVIGLLKEDFSFEMERSIQVIKHRLELFGANVTDDVKQGPYRVKLTIYNVLDKQRLNRLITSYGEIGFYKTFEAMESYQLFMRLVKKLNYRDSIYAAENGAFYESTQVLNKFTNLVQFNVSQGINGQVSFMNGSAFLMAKSIDTSTINEIVKDTILRSMSLPLVHFVWDKYEARAEGYDAVTYLHVVKAEFRDKPVLTGDVIVEARANCDPQLGSCRINMHFNADGAEKFSKLTRENLGKAIAIIMDGKVICAPTIATPIDDGNMDISGNFSRQEADDLAAMLRSGSLPLKFSVVDSKKLK